MILPFHKDITQQEFRKFSDDQDLLRQIKFYSESERIPAFVFETDFTELGNITSYIVYVDDLGNEIERVELTNGEIIQKLYLGKILYISNGDVLNAELLYCRYYLEIENTIGNTFYSEVITKINEQKADGRLKLNTGAFYLLNTGGFILLNTAQDGYILDKLTRIKASTTKNYGNSDFNGVELIHYVDTRPYLEENYENTISEENAGVETILQKVITSVYSLTFFAVEAVADNLQNLTFFDTVEITTPENKTYEVFNRVEVLREERLNTSGIYQIKITFKTQYRIDLQISDALNIVDDNRVDYLVGKINFSPAFGIGIAELLAVKNTLLEGTGFEAVQCLGQDLIAANYPVAASIMGTWNDGGIEKVNIPDLSGLIPVGSGGYQDKNGDTFNFTSSQYDWGNYSHKLDRDEMYNFHVVGGTGLLEYFSGSVQVVDSFAKLKQEDLAIIRDLTGLTEYDNDDISYGDLETRFINLFNGSNVNSNVLAFTNVANSDRFISTLNDNDNAVKTNREYHNNIQPCVAAWAWTIIDKV